MPNIIVNIGKKIEVDAEKLLLFIEKMGQTAEKVVTPQALIALAVLAVPVGEAVAVSLAAASQDGLNIVLDEEAARLIVSLWPALQIYLKTLAIHQIDKEKK